MITNINEINAAQPDTDSNARLNILWLSENESGIILLLGCPLDLTQREAGILRSIIRHYPKAASLEDICDENTPLGAGSVPVHVNSINKKAALIGGRRLIIAQRKIGYILNRFM